jgi:hypothetical protein
MTMMLAIEIERKNGTKTGQKLPGNFGESNMARGDFGANGKCQ